MNNDNLKTNRTIYVILKKSKLVKACGLEMESKDVLCSEDH
jgi:hypothetical protein